MNWLRRWLGRGPRLHPEQSLALAAYRAQPVATAVTPLATLRFIVADVETTGLSPYVDRLISIGAVEVSAGKVRLGSGFEVVFRQPAGEMQHDDGDRNDIKQSEQDVIHSVAPPVCSSVMLLLLVYRAAARAL